jgi:aldose 1-epimerase
MGERINGGYDQSFVIDKKPGHLSMVAEVQSKRSGLKLQLMTTEPVVHFYTGQGLTKLKGKNNTEYGPHSGFCLETQIHPNAINVPKFPNTVLRPGEKYYQKTVYKIVI